MKSDTWLGSLLWGRLGASILMVLGIGLQAYGYEFSADQQQAVFQIISTILGGGGALMAIFSKVREKKREKPTR